MQRIATIAAFAVTCLALPARQTRYDYYTNGMQLSVSLVQQRPLNGFSQVILYISFIKQLLYQIPTLSTFLSAYLLS
ncbi:hypothetical protein V8C40DRAFT_257042 [Trichoderma camerunense]